MTTRIILHGGNANRDTEKNERFYNEIIITSMNLKRGSYSKRTAKLCLSR